jgi:hypothetical protein
LKKILIGIDLMVAIEHPDISSVLSTSGFPQEFRPNLKQNGCHIIIVPNDVLTDGGFLLIRDDNSFQKSYTSLEGSPRYSFGVLSKFNEGIYLLYKDVFFKILTFGYNLVLAL